jgi:hypothetical protein
MKTYDVTFWRDTHINQRLVPNERFDGRNDNTASVYVFERIRAISEFAAKEIAKQKFNHRIYDSLVTQK